MAKQPGVQDIQELVAFLPIFAAAGFDPVVEWKGGEILPDGSSTFPWPVYQDAVVEFFRLAGGDAWSDYEYVEKDAPALIEKPGFFERASLDEIRTVITFCVRGERFCDGHWAAVIREGLVQRTLERLVLILEHI